MNLITQLPIFAVIIPLLSAPLCVLVARGVLAWLVALMASWVSVVASSFILLQVHTTGTISYELGGWAPPWGIEYRIDLLGAYVLLIVSAIAALTLSFAYRSVEREIPKQRHAYFYAAFLLAFAGLAGIVITGDAFNVFVFLEISSLSSYALISMGKDRRALSASFQYLVMGTIGATFILIGIGFLYMMTGTLNMQDLAERLPAVSDTTTVRAGFAFLTIGIGLKLALFPLHLWLPNAYAYAPSVVTIFLAATATKVALYAMIRFVFTIFGVEFSFAGVGLEYILLPLAVAAVISASIVAIFQDNVKRLLAYSSVAQIGYMVMGIGLVSASGLTATLLHLFNHALMKGALFMALGAIFYQIGSVQLKDMAGLGKRMPITMAAVVVGGLSLIGVPLTVGFISKWYLISAALEHGWWWLIVVILIGSLLAVVYVWRIIEIAYFKAMPEGVGHSEAPLSLLIPTWLLVAANVYFGIDTSLTVGTAEAAAMALMGGQG